jgi:3-hydroxyisobutyrate dehydrogenase-like beta-hydroxyacid dehydrogenase
MNVAFLHPGLMGESLAANCAGTRLWVSSGRSAETRLRAEANGLVEVAELADVVEQADVIVSICPPAAAVDVADQVAHAGFTGLYVDANAISPQNAREIAGRFEHAVDGSVIGPPAHRPGTTRLYLSGVRASDVAELFAAGHVDARVIGDEPGPASALKMAYASWTKIGSAMHLAIRALAEHEGVDSALVDEWNLSQPGMVERSDAIAARVSPKAWRFAGEMEQIAHTFAAAGLPDGFAVAAHEIWTELAGFKGTTGTTLAEVVETLNRDDS